MLQMDLMEYQNVYIKFFESLNETDILFVVNEDKNGIKGQFNNYHVFSHNNTNMLASYAVSLEKENLDNIDYNHEWHTEPSNLEGFKEEYSTVCGISLLSLYEYEKYIDTNLFVWHVLFLEAHALFFSFLGY